MAKRRNTGPRRTWHGAHVEQEILAAARRSARRSAWGVGTLSPPYIIMLLLMALIILLLARPWLMQPAIDRFSAAGGSSVSFSYCGGGARVNCVVDGDTFWMEGQKIRILDIDTPELSPPRCAEEERLGLAAKRRLHALLNSGAVTLHREGRNRDRYGRLLRRATVDGQSVGAVLISEGLARPYGGGRRSWCG